MHVVIISDGDHTAGRGYTGEEAHEFLKRILDDVTRDQAVVVDCIAVGTSVAHETVEALTQGTKGYYGYAPDAEALPKVVGEAMAPFALSNKPFALRVRDGRFVPGADQFFGLLHAGNCTTELELEIAAKAGGGKHPAALVGLLKDGVAPTQSTLTTLFLDFVEDEEAHDAWLANEHQAPAIFHVIDNDKLFEKECVELLADELAKDAGIEGAIEALTKHIADRSVQITDAARARAEVMLQRTKERAADLAAKGSANVFNPNAAMLFAQASRSHSQTMPAYISPASTMQSIG